MKNVRIWFEKDGATRYISHLDLNRCMSRVMQRAKIPLWHTEGFNPHPFMTFALPLSLGIRGKRESMDIKLEKDISEQELLSRLNACLPEGIRVFAVTEPVMKPGKIAYALYQLNLQADELDNEGLKQSLQRVLDMPQLTVLKKSKSGVKEVDIKPQLGACQLAAAGDCVSIQIVLPAGSSNNINPGLLLDAFRQYGGLSLNADITRLDIYNEEMKPFQ